MTNSLLTPPEAASLLAISKRRLYRLTEAGLIPAVRLGRSLRFAPEVLEAIIASGGVRTTGWTPESAVQVQQRGGE